MLRLFGMLMPKAMQFPNQRYLIEYKGISHTRVCRNFDNGEILYNGRSSWKTGGGHRAAEDSRRMDVKRDATGRCSVHSTGPLIRRRRRPTLRPPCLKHANSSVGCCAPWASPCPNDAESGSCRCARNGSSTRASTAVCQAVPPPPRVRTHARHSRAAHPR